VRRKKIVEQFGVFRGEKGRKRVRHSATKKKFSDILADRRLTIRAGSWGGRESR